MNLEKNTIFTSASSNERHCISILLSHFFTMYTFNSLNSHYKKLFNIPY